MQMRGEGLRPFAAMSGKIHSDSFYPYQQFGLRRNKTHGKVGVYAEVSHINESDSFWGANFGALGTASTATQQGRIIVSGDLTNKWMDLHHTKEFMPTQTLLRADY